MKRCEILRKRIDAETIEKIKKARKRDERRMQIKQPLNISPPAVPHEIRAQGERNAVEQVQSGLEVIGQQVIDNKLSIHIAREPGELPIYIDHKCKCGNHLAYLDRRMYRCSECKVPLVLLVMGSDADLVIWD